VRVSENRFIHQLTGLSLRTVIAAVVADAPEDLEAHGWRGRLLAWKGRWSDSEAEYRLVRDEVPNDPELLTGLSDVLLWQRNYTDALQTVDQARKISPSDPEILSRRACVLALVALLRKRARKTNRLFYSIRKMGMRERVWTACAKTLNTNYASAKTSMSSITPTSARPRASGSVPGGTSDGQPSSVSAPIKDLARMPSSFSPAPLSTSPRGTDSPSVAPLPTVRVVKSILASD